MISNPTKQRNLRGHRASRPNPRLAVTVDHQAQLAWRLTPRDRWIIRMLHEHRVLTTTQISDLAFTGPRLARQRLRELFQYAVVDRFQPFVTLGTAPMHYVLSPAGAAVLAAEDGLEVKDLGYRQHRAFGIAHSLTLAHTVGVGDWFTALIARSRYDSTTALTAWWSETRCARLFGDLVKPDAYGRWRHNDREIEFFLEYDLGTEQLATVAAKLHGYACLAAASGIATPLLVWLPTSRREAAARRLLTRTWHELDHPDQVPVATASAKLLNPHAPQPSPADPVWLPVHTSGQPTRSALHELLDVWQNLPRSAPTHVSADSVDSGQAARRTLLPAPPPMPPVPSTSDQRSATRRR
ncbi:replication-relaxation family protein [Lentzea kentuckyensis]|uniref:replication-relaxation family protein n=1 Tax=Lentzea kentuckyensis TaxID=360086 RepID=UPI000A38DF56|nr:replication-relaxation family protein [Lentzea kentuckyensis]